MRRHALHPLAEDYMRRLRQAGRQLPPARRGELLTEIEAYLAEALSPDASDDEALEVLDRLGSPGEIIAAERPSAPEPSDRRGWRERAAVVLLPLGGFALGVGWLVGLIFLWSSRLWTTREKLIGTLIVPGGIASALLVVVLTGTKRRCVGFAGAPLHCTPSGGASATTTAWHAALVAFFVLGPVLTAIYLARRARARSAFVTASMP